MTDSYHFKDEDELVYQFKMDFSHKLELMDLILPPHDSPDSVRGHEVQPEPIIHR